jgi:hypothetical protein
MYYGEIPVFAGKKFSFFADLVTKILTIAHPWQMIVG